MNQTNPETSEVREQHRFDVEALRNYMADQIPGFSGELDVQQFLFGQSNPTFILNDGRQQYVMRKKPPGKLLPSAHAVEREYRILTALQSSDVPVAKTHALCEDDSIIGTPFYIMAFVQGRIFREPHMPGLSDPAERTAIIDGMNDTLIKIHTVDWEANGLSSFGKPGNYMARQVNRWSKQYVASKTDEIESMDRLIQWLPGNIPDDDSTTIVHGDYRLENMIIHPTEPRCVAVLDWEISTLGHPLADLAYNCMGYHLPDFEKRAVSYQGVDLEALGIPSEKEYVAAYCRRSGRDEILNWEFFLAFSVFRLASIVQGVYKRGLDGNASSEDAKSYGAYARFLSDEAWKIAEKGVDAAAPQ
jgi:aminoglycoside phosphotransferase (APT) family kinase protein